jgi:hypothetical protein
MCRILYEWMLVMEFRGANEPAGLPNLTAIRSARLGVTFPPNHAFRHRMLKSRPAISPSVRHALSSSTSLIPIS